MKIIRIMPIVAVVIAVLVLSTSSIAGTIEQTKTFDGTPDFSRLLTFDQFNDQGGSCTLTSIRVILTLNVEGGQIVLDNDSETQATGTFEFGGKCGITSSQVALLNNSSQPIFGQAAAIHSESVTLAANEGDGSKDYSGLGPDGMIYQGGSETDTKSGYIGSSYWTGFIGTGTYDIGLSAIQWSSCSTISGVEYSVTPVTASGTVKVIYEATCVPEPSAIAGLLTALVGMGFGLRRRVK